MDAAVEAARLEYEQAAGGSAESLASTVRAAILGEQAARQAVRQTTSRAARLASEADAEAATAHREGHAAAAAAGLELEAMRAELVLARDSAAADATERALLRASAAADAAERAVLLDSRQALLRDVAELRRAVAPFLLPPSPIEHTALQ